jgi:DNA sulfur modification protein DndC
MLDDLPETLNLIRRDLQRRYESDDHAPWIVGFSGGKDSSLLLHLVVEMLLEVSPDQRTRPVYILTNDTGVESPVYQDHVDNCLEHITAGLAKLRIPVEVARTGPTTDTSFWVNLLGRGYPAPNRNFRWCTDRMKIRPTTRFLREQVQAHGRAVLLLGVRKAESTARANRLKKYEDAADDGLSPHNDIADCWILSPIADLTNEEVWMLLLQLRPPWGGTHRGLRKLYSEASGGECPFIVDDTAAASCGSGSARFGCWTCTVVEKDGSIDGLIDSGMDHLQPLSDFRERIKRISADPDMRRKTRRNGQPGLGPLTFAARKQLLRELLEIQGETEMSLITPQEVRLIEDQWSQDQSDDLLREHARYQTPTVRGR